MSESRLGFADADPTEGGSAPVDGNVDVVIDDGAQATGAKPPKPRPVADASPADRVGEAFGRRRERQISALLGRAKTAEERLAALEAENAALRRGTLQEGHGRLAAEEAHIKSELARVQRDLKAARDAGDTDAEMAAVARMSTLNVHASRVGEQKANVEREVARVPAPPPPKPPPTPTTEAWMAANEWFRTDPAMTQASLGFHSDAVRNGKQVDTPEYYQHIDRRMRAAFPDYFDDEPRRTGGGDAHDGDGDAGTEVDIDPPRQPPRPAAAAPVAAPAPRRNAPPPAAGNRTPRTIRLTPEQVEVARSLKLTPQQYAAALMARRAGAAR